MIEGFIFYKSFSDAVDALPAEQYKAVVQAACHYAIYGEIPEDLDPVCLAMFTLIRPQIDANSKRREAGRKGGEANAKQNEANAKQTEANPKQNEAKPKQNEANVKQNEANAKQIEAKEKEKDKDKREREINKEKEALDARGYSGKLREAVEEWLRYRHKIRKPYTDLEGFLDKIDKDRKEHDDNYVVEMVAYSKGQGYQGLFAEKKARSGTTNFSNERKYDPSIETILLGES